MAKFDRNIVTINANRTLELLDAARKSFPGQVHETNERSSKIRWELSRLEDVERDTTAEQGALAYLDVLICFADEWLEDLAKAISINHLSHWRNIARNASSARREETVLNQAELYQDIKCKYCWDTGLCHICVNRQWSYEKNEQSEYDKVFCSSCSGTGYCKYCQQ